MEKCNYNELQIEENEGIQSETENKTWKPFLRQMYVVTGVWSIYFALGLSFGAPTVLISQMRKEANSTDAVSHEMESWLSSVHGYSSLPFVAITSISTQLYGRKIPFILVTLNTVVANIVFYYATTTTHILISEIMHGVLLGSNMTLLLPISAEYMSPHYRSMLMTIKATCFFWGVWIANIVGTFFHWKNIGIIGLVCCTYSLSALFWPESPSWLAMKGRYQEAASAHHWLKGYDVVSERELKNLIKSQREHQDTRKNLKSKSFVNTLKLIVITTTSKGYYYPLLLTVATMSMYHFSGKFVCVMYAVQLIHQITNSEETAYVGMLLLEGITIFGMSFGCFISKYLKRKTLLLTSTSIAIISLFAIALYLYLIKLHVFTENKIISLLFLGIFSISISCGPLIVVSPLFGEIVALQYRCSSLLTITVYSEILMATILKLSPSMFRIFALHGMFLFFATFTSIFACILYKYLPETKGKSLQEIEHLFRPSLKKDVTINVLGS